MAANFTAINATILVLLLTVAIYTDTAIRMLVNEKLPQQERFHLWGITYQGRKKYYKKYRELYPASRLPLISKTAVLLAAVSYVLFVSRG